jgi:uncharacterized membrane protein YgdD (TMEM256/DUF423 family)
MISNKNAMRIAAFAGLLAVALGAFGAHGLKTVLQEHQTTEIWEKAVFYHFIHGVMLFLLAGREPMPRAPWIAFAVGIVVFSGSLYIMAVSNLKWLGAVTPLGGIGFMAGWILLMISAGGGKNSARSM